MPVPVEGCPFYGNAYYGVDTYCRRYGTVEFGSTFEDFDFGWMVDWVLQSPDSTIWTPAFDLASGLTFTSGSGTITTVPVFPQMGSNTVWRPSISNTGALTLTSEVYDGTQVGAAILDSNMKAWVFVVTPDLEFQVTDHPQYTQLKNLVYISLKLKYSPTNPGKISSTHDFVISRIAMNLNHRRDRPNTHWTNVDFSLNTHTSVKFKLTTNTDFNIGNIRCEANTKKHKPRG